MSESDIAPPDEEQPRRGRRRRRRGRRRGGHDKVDGQGSDRKDSGTDRRAAQARGSKGAPERAQTASAHEPDDRRTTQKAHERRRDEAAVASEREVEDRWEDETPVEELDEVESTVNAQDDEDADTLSDWNVPSWQDLIASLYRPDR